MAKSAFEMKNRLWDFDNCVARAPGSIPLNEDPDVLQAVSAWQNGQLDSIDLAEFLVDKLGL